MNRPLQRFAAWFACFAMLLAALAPSVSLALSADRTGNALGELCSATGAKRFSIWSENRHDPSAPAKTDLHFKQCPFCQAHGAPAALLPPEHVVPSVPSRIERLSRLPSLLLHAQSAWPAGQPRGPPFLS